MFKIWKGFGFFVLFIAAGCVFGGMFLSSKFGGENYWNRNSWPAAATLVAAGVICWFLGRKLNKPARKDANPQRPWTHDLFFVRMEMWAFPLAALAVAVLITNFRPGSAARAVKAAAAEQTQRLVPGSK